MLRVVFYALSFVLAATQQLDDTETIEESNCTSTVWPFTKSCSGFGDCINGSCQCHPGVLSSNDFVLVSGSCLTDHWSRFLISVLLAILCIVPLVVGFYRSFLYRPLIDFTASPKSLLLCTFFQYACMQLFLAIPILFQVFVNIFLVQLSVCIMALANFWVLSSTTFSLLFLFQLISSSIAGTVWSLFVFKINYTQFITPHQYQKLRLMYVTAAIVYSVLSTVAVVCAHFLGDSVFREICIRSIAVLYSMLVCFWGAAGYYQMKMIFRTLERSKNPRLASVIQGSLTSLIYGCLVSTSIGAVGAVVPHWNFHIYLVIKIAGALNITSWIYNFEKSRLVGGANLTETTGLIQESTSSTPATPIP